MQDSATKEGRDFFLWEGEKVKVTQFLTLDSASCVDHPDNSFFVDTYMKIFKMIHGIIHWECIPREQFLLNDYEQFIVKRDSIINHIRVQVRLPNSRINVPIFFTKWMTMFEAMTPPFTIFTCYGELGMILAVPSLSLFTPLSRTSTFSPWPMRTLEFRHIKGNATFSTYVKRERYTNVLFCVDHVAGCSLFTSACNPFVPLACTIVPLTSLICHGQTLFICNIFFISVKSVLAAVFVTDGIFTNRSTIPKTPTLHNKKSNENFPASDNIRIPIMSRSTNRNWIENMHIGDLSLLSSYGFTAVIICLSSFVFYYNLKRKGDSPEYAKLTYW